MTIVATAPTVAAPTVFNGFTATIAPNAGGPVDPNAANNTATRSVTVAPDGADLSVTKSKTPGLVALGSNMTSTIVVSNAGPRTAASGTVTLVDALEANRPAARAVVTGVPRETPRTVLLKFISQRARIALFI